MAAESSLVERPIILDRDSLLLDGRNRLAACQLAGVEPRFETLDGQDPVAYILSSNIQRRQMTKGQTAMAVARVRDFQFLKITDAAEQARVSVGRVGQAVTVLTHAPDLADAVLSGATPLDTAYEQARARKGVACSMEAQIATAAPLKGHGSASSARGPVLPGRFESVPAGRPHPQEERKRSCRTSDSRPQ